MKNIALFIFVIVGLMTSCDPICDEKDPGGSITAEQLKNYCTVTVDQENGVNINHIKVSTTAPCNVVWNNGVENKLVPTTDFTMLITGEQTVTCTAMNGDGSIVKAEFTVNIQEISKNYPVKEQWGLLCGTGTKTWKWDDSTGQCWGNCGYLSGTGTSMISGNSWWGAKASEITDQITKYKYSLDDCNNGNATMTLSLNGAKITKTSGGTGTFSFDMSSTTMDAGGDGLWGIGKFTTTGDGILFPVQINTGTVVSTLDIAALDKDHFVLTYAASGTGSWGEATFWRFKPAE